MCPDTVSVPWMSSSCRSTATRSRTGQYCARHWTACGAQATGTRKGGHPGAMQGFTPRLDSKTCGRRILPLGGQDTLSGMFTPTWPMLSRRWYRCSTAGTAAR